MRRFTTNMITLTSRVLCTQFLKPGDGNIPFPYKEVQAAKFDENFKLIFPYEKDGSTERNFSSPLTKMG